MTDSTLPTTFKSTLDLDRLVIVDVGRRPWMLAMAGAVCLATAGAISLVSSAGLPRLMHAYLLSVCFVVSLSLGALFFVILQHLTAARWSVVTRRIAELMTVAMPVLALLMIPMVLPMLFGNSDLYSWNSASRRATDPLIRAKAAYLNAPFFAIRCAIYFSIWICISRFFLNNSLRQDLFANQAIAARMRRWSGPAMIAFALTTNFAAFDWLMSLDPHWFSTIFGVYFFAGCVVAFLAALPVATALLQRFGYITQEVTTEHFHDMGKLLFGFVMFWAYIAFSQYLLIWYANIPEETEWFLTRQSAGWQYVGLLLIAGHFVLPFLGLMSRSSRRNRSTLLLWSVFLLLMHWIDLFWLVVPNVSPDVVRIGLLELLCTCGVGAIWFAATLHSVAGKRLTPTGDEHLRTSLAFHNV